MENMLGLTRRGVKQESELRSFLRLIRGEYGCSIHENEPFNK